MDPRIADYIRANRRQYTRDAITKQLLEAGHDPAEVERTWAALESPDADQVAGEGFWGRFAIILIGVNVGVFVVVGLLTGMLQNLPSSAGIAVILAIAMGIGALMAWGLVAATGPARLGRTTALVIGIAIPSLFALLIGGSCYALIGTLGGMGTPASPPMTAVMDVSFEGPLETDQTTEGVCHPTGDDSADGMWVTGSIEAPGGWAEVSISAVPGAPTMTVSWYRDIEEAGSVWSSDMGLGQPTLDMALDGAGGTLAFTDLPAAQVDPKSDIGAPLSGEVTWSCRQHEEDIPR